MTSKITAHNRLLKIHLPCYEPRARPGVSTLDAPFSAVVRFEPLWQELLDKLFSYQDHDPNHTRAYLTISTPSARIVSSSNVSAQKRTGRLRKTSSCNIADQKLPEDLSLASNVLIRCPQRQENNTDSFRPNDCWQLICDEPEN